MGLRQYYLKSIINEIAIRIQSLIEHKIITCDKKILLYGLDRNSYAMRTILSNYGFNNIEGYISEDESLVRDTIIANSQFAGRFLNNKADLIPVWTLEERLGTFDKDAFILIVSEDYKEKEYLENMGYQESIHFFRVYDLIDIDVDNKTQNKKRMNLDEVKKVEKNMLQYIDQFCAEKELRYWVCGGTLLGTIRHEGFIPWDDDIDIFLPWQDFCVLLEQFKETDDYSVMGFGDPANNSLNYVMARVVDKNTVMEENLGTVRIVDSVWIDIFPLVGLPEDVTERKTYFARYQELNRRIWQDFYEHNGSIEVFPNWYGKQKEFLSKYDFDSSNYVGVLGTAYKEKDCTKRSVYDVTLRKKFEDIFVNVPAGYKEYLDNLYGTNWMQLPEESKRKSHHNVKMYWN